jgi:hypothetical protein
LACQPQRRAQVAGEHRQLQALAQGGDGPEGWHPGAGEEQRRPLVLDASQPLDLRHVDAGEHLLGAQLVDRPSARAVDHVEHLAPVGSPELLAGRVEPVGVGRCEDQPPDAKAVEG